MKKIFLLIFILFFKYSFCQRNIILIDSESRKPIENALLKDCNIDSTYKLISNAAGIVNLANFCRVANCVEISHVNYGVHKINFNNSNVHQDTIFLVERIQDMDEVVLKSSTKKYLNYSLMRFFFNYKLSLGHNHKIAQIVYKKDFRKKISKIKIQIIDGLGVKNLKYLPFKVSIYNVDTLTIKPNQSIYTTEAIRKNNDNKWVYIDVEKLDLYSNNQDLFLVFETLSKDDYPVTYINSKIGPIAAVPMIKAEIFTPKNKIKCYVNVSNHIEELSNWEFIECQLFLDFEYEK